MGKTKFAVLATLVAAGALAATAAVASTNKSSSISLRTTKVGKVLVAANGRTLYSFTADKGKKSACYGQCAVYWPPLIPQKATVGAGLTSSLLGMTKRRGGKLQLTYGGEELRHAGWPGARLERGDARALGAVVGPGFPTTVRGDLVENGRNVIAPERGVDIGDGRGIGGGAVGGHGAHG